MNKLLIALLFSTTAYAQPQQVTTINDPMGQLIGTITNQGYESIVTDKAGQVTAVITNPTPTYTPPPLVPAPAITTPIAPQISMPTMPAAPTLPSYMPSYKPFGVQ